MSIGAISPDQEQPERKPEAVPVHGMPDIQPRQDPPSLPLFPKITEPSPRRPPTRDEINLRDGVDEFRPPAAAHSFTANTEDGTLSLLCQASGAEFVMEAVAGEATKCQGCGFELRVEAFPLDSVPGPASGDFDVRLVERDEMEQAIIAEADRAKGLVPAEHAGELVAREGQRVIADLMKRATRRVQIGNFALPLEWVREQADPGCKLGCGGAGHVPGDGGRLKFCMCARTRATQRLNAHMRARATQPQDVDPPKNLRTEAEAKRLQRAVDGLATQVRDAEGALAIRDADHEAALASAAASLSSEIIGASEVEARQIAAVRDAESAAAIARAKASHLREYVAQYERRLAGLREELSGAEAAVSLAERDAEVASTLATEAGERASRLRAHAEHDAERLTREHEKRTAGARAELAKLQRRLALAEARR